MLYETPKKKNTLTLTHSLHLRALIGLLPSVLAGAASRAVGYKTSMSFSNFPGPQFPMYFADHKVNSIIVSTRPHHTLHCTLRPLPLLPALTPQQRHHSCTRFFLAHVLQWHRSHGHELGAAHTG